MFKQFGSLYLILGTCIGAGMLGLPIVTAQYHFALTVMMLLSAWFLMTAGAWCLLKVNVNMPANANFISMSQATLGTVVKYITWCAYLLLLYSLICMYLAASGDLLQALLKDIHIMIPRWCATVLATVILGGIVYRGIGSVDMSNRFLLSVKFIICVILIATVIPFAHVDQLVPGNWDFSYGSWLAVVTSFGFATILPSIRDYLNNDKKKLTRVLFIGSCIPLVLYVVWIAVIQGSLHRFGADGLVAMNNSAHTNSLLMSHIAALTHYSIVKTISVVFISICSVTGFLGVSLCLMDFLADGFKKEKHGSHRPGIAALAFLPPMLIVLFDPSIFIFALQFAGACCLYILVVLPIAMLIGQRMRRKVA